MRAIVYLLLSLSLFVFRIFADHHDVAMALDDFALVADFLDGRSDFHALPPMIFR
jgi:hypothetical protein